MSKTRPMTIEFQSGVPVHHVHCAGVGGMGVGPLAVYLAGRGLTVTGEDDALNAAMRPWLERAGVVLTTPGEFPPETQLVIHSTALGDEHPVRRAALARGLPTLRRGLALAAALRGRRLIAIAGAHGKTTTTALLIWTLHRAGFTSEWILGGLFGGDALAPAHARPDGDWVVAEIDESDGTIEAFAPALTLATHVDWDHPDFYATAADLEAAYARLFARTTGPVLVGPLPDALAAELARRPTPPMLVGPAGDFAYVPHPTPRGQTLDLTGRFALPRVEVAASGAFNAQNAAAALAAAQLIGATLRPELLADFPGVQRRQTQLTAPAGITVIEDYAHHPVEIRALLQSLRPRVPAAGRLVVAFQPHRHTRTAQFGAEFVATLALADRVHLLDVYAAGEAPVAGGSSADLAARLRANHPSLRLNYAPDDIEAFIAGLDVDVRRGDVVAIVGAGDIDQVARRWLASRNSPEAAMAAAHWDELAAELRGTVSTATRILREEPLAPRTTMGVGGPARLWAEPASVDDLRSLWGEAQARHIPIFFIGRGSNLIVPDTGVEGLVLSLGHSAWTSFIPEPDGAVWVGAGLRLKELCGKATTAGLRGFEFLEGIPGTVGGALRMNAGAMGGWIFDIVEEVELLRPDGRLERRPRPEFHVDYRHCAELTLALALGARLRPTGAAATEEIRQQIEAYRRKRHASQPRERSAGCIFKNPPDDSAGRLIDECGLKGRRIGDAEVSLVHGNFIINRGTARAADVIALVREVRAAVQAQRGITLEPEALLFGADWKDVLGGNSHEQKQPPPDSREDA